MGDNSEPPATPAAVEEFYPGHAADLRKKQARDAEIARANADPLPGPLREAFAHVPQTLGGLTVRRLVHYDWTIFRALKSPLIEALADLEREVAYTDQQGWDMVFVLTRPPRVSEALLARGVDVLSQAAREEIGQRLNDVEVNLLVRAVQREVVRSFATAIRYAPRAPAEDGTVFTMPPAEPMTASAGGSIICAA